MKAVLIHDMQGPNSVRVDDVEVPSPGSGEVRIRVKAAAMNNSDLQTTYGTYRVGYTGLPHLLGQEAAGEVDAVGEGVTGLVPGMRVVGHVKGAFAEMAIGSATELLPLPKQISWEVAASLPVAYLTASMALVHQAKLQAGEWVLVHPGSGGVGTAAIQLAKLLGGRAIATAGTTAKVERLKELGAEQVLDYSNQDVVSEVRRICGETGVQVALDGGGKVTLPHCLDAIASHGRIVSYGYTTGKEVTFPIVKLIGRNAKLYGMGLWFNSDYQASLETMQDLVIPAFAEGKLQPVIDKVISLAEVSEALLRMKQRGIMGKIVVVPASEHRKEI
ncbi:MAG: NADPH:quinone oxidoreductase family protein [Symploca sp. SIO1A3]|nr:NADPH:quinone oxidoreductase family protein [Symploca sp. SIO1A3]